jgi:hypothetical protein
VTSEFTCVYVGSYSLQNRHKLERRMRVLCGHGLR